MRSRLLRLLLGAAALLAVPLAAAAPAHAALPVGSDSHTPTAVSEVGTSGDRILGPGDTLAVTETIIASQDVTGMSATLTSATPGVSVVQGSSTYPDLVLGQSAPNDVAFRIQLQAEPLTTCGAPIALNLTVTGTAAGDSAPSSVTIPIKIATGATGEYVPLTSTHVPRPIPIQGVVDSELDVSGGGRVKGVRVHIGSLDHTYVGDLRISLVAENGTSAILFNQLGGTADNMRDVTFVASGGADPATLTPPYTGATINAPALANLDGLAANGKWKLRIDDRKFSDSGRLDAWGMDLATATCDGRPVARFTYAPQPALPNTPITFDGTTSSDATDAITLYEWDLDGDTVFGEPEDATGPVVTTQYDSPRSVAVGLRITAGGDVSPTTTMTIPVTGPPVAALEASATAPLSLTNVTLDASDSTDPDGGTLERFEFDLDGDGDYDVDNGENPILVTSFADPGPREVIVKVTDNFGAQGTATVAIDVVNRPPTATLGVDPEPVIVGEPATLSASEELDLDGDIVGHEWDVDGDGTYDASTGTTPSLDYTYTAAGPTTATLRITDSDGAVTELTHDFVVTRPPLAAVTATPSTASFGQTVTLDAGASSDPDGATLAGYEWDFVAGDADGDGDPWDRDTTTATTTTSWATAGVRTVHVRVTDAAGATAVATTTVTVRNALPIAALTATPTAPVTGAIVALSAAGSSDSDGTVVAYQWDLDGDGSFERSTGASNTTTATYPNPGNVRVRVRVTDDDGGTGVKFADLTVLAPTASGTPGATPQNPAGTGTGTTPGGGSPGGGAVEPAGDGDPGGDDGDGAAGGPDGLTAVLAGTPLQRLRAVTRSGMKLSCQASFDGRCVLEAFLSRADARRLGVDRRARKDVRIGRASALLTAGRPAAVKLRLSAAARRGMRRAKRVRVLVRGFARDRISRRVELSRVVLVRR